MRFPMRGDGYDPAMVDEFLEQVASSVEVLTSADVTEGMRRELQRSSEISSRMVLAGQEAAERLRQQAASDARTIIEDTKHLAEQLRDAARAEVEQSQAHVASIRHSFLDELRDMYDRIGATLHRFERAGDAGDGGHVGDTGGNAMSALAGEPISSVGLVGEYEDIPMAPGEPLVDLTAFHAASSAEASVAVPSVAGEAEAHGTDFSDWLVSDDTAPSVVITDDGVPDAEIKPVDPAAPPVSPFGAGAYTMPAPLASAPDAGAPPLPGAAPAVVDEHGSDAQQPPVDENARAEALLATMGGVLAAATPPEPAPLPQPPVLEQAHSAGPDPIALQQFVLQSLHEGMDRTVIEAWIAERYGIQHPAAVVDAALNAQAGGA
jgi:hypothetical protein